MLNSLDWLESLEYQAYQWGIQPSEIGEYSLLQIATYIVAQSDKKIMEEQLKSEYDKRMVYLMGKITNDFLAVTLSKTLSKHSHAKYPTYEDIFPDVEVEEIQKGVYYDNDKGIVVDKKSAFDYLVEKQKYFDEKKK